MMTREKLTTILLIVAVFLAVFLLAASLTRLQLSTDPILDLEILGLLFADLRQLAVIVDWLIILLLVGLVAFFLFSKPSRLRPRVELEQRGSFVGNLLRVLFLVLALLVIHRQLRGRQLDLNPGSPEPIQIVPPTAETLPALVDVPQWLSFIFGFGMFLVLGFWGWTILRRRQSADNTIQVIQKEAQAAIDDLESGVDLRNVILRCYCQMEDALKKQKGLKRHKGMTPREFETSLSGFGIPEQPLIILTRLFEAVRYGDKQLDPERESQAIACLTAIVRACEGKS